MKNGENESQKLANKHFKTLKIESRNKLSSQRSAQITAPPRCTNLTNSQVTSNQENKIGTETIECKIVQENKGRKIKRKKSQVLTPRLNPG